jgi:glutamate--cysteine ligase
LLEPNIDWLTSSNNADLVRGGLRGVEKESLRVDDTGHLSQRPHPEVFGAALTHPYLTTDYSEALLEFVTPPLTTNWETLQFLCDLHAFVHRGLDDELLWPASMPCIVNPDQAIPIAEYGSSNAGQVRTIYRRGLGFRYGRAMQAIAGAHFNYSIREAFWPEYQEWRRTEASGFKDEQLMGLVRNYRRCAWLTVYLFGASPALCKSFRPRGHALLSELDAGTWYGPYATSLRMSDIGYRNSTQARLNISANSLDEYVAGLTRAVSTPDPAYAGIGVLVGGEYRQLNTNTLQIENEYYTSIRPKPSDRTLRPVAALRRDGIGYVEVRTLDLNAADPVGVNQEQMRFLEALLLYCLLAKSPPIDAAEQAEIDARDVQVAREGRRPGLELAFDGKPATVAAAGARLLSDIATVAAALDGEHHDYTAAVAAASSALRDPSLTPSARLLAALRDSGATFFDFAFDLARRHQAYFRALPLPSERHVEFEAAAARSLAEAAALEARPDVSLDEYVRQYSDVIDEFENEPANL